MADEASNILDYIAKMIQQAHESAGYAKKYAEEAANAFQHYRATANQPSPPKEDAAIIVPTPQDGSNELPKSGRLIPWGARVTGSFIDSILWIEDQIGLKPEVLMPCIAFETGRTFSPSKKNPRSSATGLIQFMESTAKKLGTTTAKLANMSAVTQLSYVYRYFEDFHKRGFKLDQWDELDCYMAILWPAGIGQSIDFPIFDRNRAANVYEVNKGLDANRDGIVTKGEAGQKILDIAKEGYLPQNVEVING